MLPVLTAAWGLPFLFASDPIRGETHPLRGPARPPALRLVAFGRDFPALTWEELAYEGLQRPLCVAETGWVDDDEDRAGWF